MSGRPASGIRGVALLLLSFIPWIANADTIYVTNANDSGSGSLRAAIEQANATPVRDNIRPSFDSCGSPCAVALLSPLPPITRPARIELLAIDGTSAGAGAHGIVIQAPDVAVEEVSVANFSGDGIVVDADRAYVAFARSSGNRNGIRVEKPAGVFGSMFLSNREYGIRVGPAATASAVGQPDLYCPILCFPFPAGNEVFGNGSGGIRVEASACAIDSNVVGGFPPNEGNGIEIVGAGNQVINNAVWRNSGVGILLAAPAALERNNGGCNGGPLIAGSVIEPPAILSARLDPGVLTATGTFHGQPHREYTIEVHATSECAMHPYTLIGSVLATTDAAGLAQWTAYLPTSGVTSIFTVANRQASNEASRTSANFAVHVSNDPAADLSIVSTAPAMAAHGQVLEIESVVTNHGPAAISGYGIEITVPAGTRSISTSTERCFEWDDVLFCNMPILGAGQSATIRHRLEVTGEAGTTIAHTATARSDADPDTTNNTATIAIPIVVPAAVPGLSPLGLGALAAALALAAVWVQRGS